MILNIMVIHVFLVRQLSTLTIGGLKWICVVNLNGIVIIQHPKVATVKIHFSSLHVTSVMYTNVTTQQLTVGDPHNFIADLSIMTHQYKSQH